MDWHLFSVWRCSKIFFPLFIYSNNFFLFTKSNNMDLLHFNESFKCIDLFMNWIMAEIQKCIKENILYLWSLASCYHASSITTFSFSTDFSGKHLKSLVLSQQTRASSNPSNYAGFFFGYFYYFSESCLIFWK